MWVGLNMGKDGSSFLCLGFCSVCLCQAMYLTDAWIPVILVPISVADSCVYVMVLL